MGQAASAQGAKVLRDVLVKNGRANIIVATGASQFETLKCLVKEPGIDWSKVTVFHLDEYVGLPESHGASFRKYLRERFISQLPAQPVFVPVDGDAADLNAEIKRLNDRITACPIDLCFAGIGENSHLAFNDPPADFSTEVPYIVVNLDHACRQQQFGCGAYGNPPGAVAKLFKAAVQRHGGQLEHVVFCILNDHNAGRSHNPEGNFRPFEETFRTSRPPAGRSPRGRKPPSPGPTAQREPADPRDKQEQRHSSHRAAQQAPAGVVEAAERCGVGGWACRLERRAEKTSHGGSCSHGWWCFERDRRAHV